MERRAKHWIDPALRAVNVREVEVPAPVLARLEPFVPEVRAMTPTKGTMRAGGYDFSVVHPMGWGSDILWIAQADRAGFAFFDAIFADLGLAETFAPHIACDRAPVLYSGFFVTRSRSDTPAWHYDWDGGDNQGFTLIAPISANCAELGIVYADVRGAEAAYAYRPGKGLVFGDRFYHSTAPGRTQQPTVFLSLTFGTDRMDNWDRLAATAGQQGMLHRRPDGVFMREGREMPNT